MRSSRFTKQNISKAVVDYEGGKPSQFILQFPEESKAFSCSYNKNGKFAVPLRTARTEAKEDPEEGEIGLGLDALW